jgi:putative transposase
MPRLARSILGGHIYHVLNRGVAGATVFHEASDFEAFLGMMNEASIRVRLGIVGYCLMPNHFHLMLKPRGDLDISRWMHWLLTTHAGRVRRGHGARGRIWQGRFRSFPIEPGAAMLTVLHYVEQNPVRALLVDRSENWSWSSLRWRAAAGLGPVPLVMDAGACGWEWVAQVSRRLPADEEARIRECVRRDRPYGTDSWVLATARAMGLESTLRNRGRPRLSPAHQVSGHKESHQVSGHKEC